MIEKQEYKIGHINYSQGELTWAQDKSLLKIYNKVSSLAFRNEEIKIKDIQQLLAKYDLLDHFFAIILKPKINLFYIFSLKWIPYIFKRKISLDQATNTQIGQIFSDFFLTNKHILTKLTESLKVLGLVANQAEIMKKEKNAKPFAKPSTSPSQAKTSRAGSIAN